MKYTITSTEKTKMKASDSETKAMLHLMNHYDEVYWFVIDFFNDVTGINSLGLSAWDIQSKSKKKLYGKEIGRDLVTLFKNYNSKLKFEKYIVFLFSVLHKKSDVERLYKAILETTHNAQRTTHSEKKFPFKLFEGCPLLADGELPQKDLEGWRALRDGAFELTIKNYHN